MKNEYFCLVLRRNITLWVLYYSDTYLYNIITIPIFLHYKIIFFLIYTYILLCLTYAYITY